MAITAGKNYHQRRDSQCAVIPFAVGGLLSYLPSPTNTNEYIQLHRFCTLKLRQGQRRRQDGLDATREACASSSATRKADRTSSIRAALPARRDWTPSLAGDNGDGQVYAPIKAIEGGATWTINPVSVLEARFGFSSMQAGKKPHLAGRNTDAGACSLSGLPTDPQYPAASRINTSSMADSPAWAACGPVRSIKTRPCGIPRSITRG